MTDTAVCKNCHEPIYRHKSAARWYHNRSGNSLCFIGGNAVDEAEPTPAVPEAPIVLIPEGLQHGRNCSAWKDMHGYDVNGENCTCGLRWRKEILNLQIALNSQIEITNNERAIKERAEATVVECADALKELVERVREWGIDVDIAINVDAALAAIFHATGKEW